jgi:hypothetical protein
MDVQLQIVAAAGELRKLPCNGCVSRARVLALASLFARSAEKTRVDKYAESMAGLLHACRQSGRRFDQRSLHAPGFRAEKQLVVDTDQ